VPAVSPSPTLCLVDDSDPLLGELADVPPAPGGLLELIAQVPDPGKPRGKRHGLAPSTPRRPHRNATTTSGFPYLPRCYRKPLQHNTTHRLTLITPRPARQT
jgi:hypothetical protein